MYFNTVININYVNKPNNMIKNLFVVGKNNETVKVEDKLLSHSV